MTSEFKTEIVKTKEINKIFMIVFIILYMISGFYIFMYDKENQNIYLKYLAFGIYASGIYFLFREYFIKPKKIGTLKISTEKIDYEKEGLSKSIALNELQNIYLKYMDYGSWTTHSIFGNKNYVTITEKSGDKYNVHRASDHKVLKNKYYSAADLATILKK